MKKNKLKIIISIFLVIFTILSVNSIYATDDNNCKVSFSENYLKWLELSEEEKAQTIQPRPYDIEYATVETKNPLSKIRLLSANFAATYNLKDHINIIIKDQYDTSECWAFASVSSLETNLALKNNSKTYDYSERHLDYASSNWFTNKNINEKAYSRDVEDGGFWEYAESYFTNGLGAVSEEDMPFQNNMYKINYNDILGKTISTQVYDTVDFDDYQKSQSKETIMETIKEHIKNYGSLYTEIRIGDTNPSQGEYTGNFYNPNTHAMYYNRKELEKEYGEYSDHAVAIVGWDDTYSKTNFRIQPQNDGAWIIRNSWGTEYPYNDDGYLYVSYEDVYVSEEIYGIIKANDSIDYNHIYQYNYLSASTKLEYDSNTVMIKNIFEKETEDKEYLTQVSLKVPNSCKCKVYVNTNGSETNKSNMQEVKLKYGDTENFETLNPGYHTLEFAKAIEINNNEFAVIIEIQSSTNSSSILVEDKSMYEYGNINIAQSKCFITSGNDMDNCTWEDLSNPSKFRYDISEGANSSVKAFTTDNLCDGSLKDIKIITQPTETTYVEGDDFNEEGMIIQATYYPSSINEGETVKNLDKGEYEIINGTELTENQTEVTIKYTEGDVTKEANVTIVVEKNVITNLEIETEPSKTEYIEGQKFETNGMKVIVIYKNGNTEEISSSEYEITDGAKLVLDQTSVTIKYDGKEVQQQITVKAKSVQKIEILQNPDKQKYIKDEEELELKGGKIKVIYDNGDTEEILMTSEDITATGFDKTKTGEQTITITYKTKTVQFNVEVIENKKSIESISIEKLPEKLQYIQSEEKLDLTGGKIKIKYSDKTEESILMTSEYVKTNGFDNTVVGKQTITVMYEEKTTTFNIEIIKKEQEEQEEQEDPEEQEEPIEPEEPEEQEDNEEPKNSDFSNATSKIENMKAYYYTDSTKSEYCKMKIKLSGIERNTNNDETVYYYALSTKSNNKSLDNWVKITEEQKNTNNLTFTINTQDIEDMKELSEASTLYLYVKEIAKKDDKESVAISNAIKLEYDEEDIETYLDDVKTDKTSEDDTQEEKEDKKDDDTTSEEKLPNTGVFTVIVGIVAITGIGALIFVKYYKIKDV